MVKPQSHIGSVPGVAATILKWFWTSNFTFAFPDSYKLHLGPAHTLGAAACSFINIFLPHPRLFLLLPLKLKLRGFHSSAYTILTESWLLLLSWSSLSLLCSPFLWLMIHCYYVLYALLECKMWFLSWLYWIPFICLCFLCRGYTISPWCALKFPRTDFYNYYTSISFPLYLNDIYKHCLPKNKPNCHNILCSMLNSLLFYLEFSQTSH